MCNDIEDLDPDLDQRLRVALMGGAKKSGIPWKPFTKTELREAAANGHALDFIAAIELCGILEPDSQYNTLDVYDTCVTRNPATGELMPRGNEMVQMLAADRIRQHQQLCHEYGERLIDPRYAPSYDESDPLTATRLYVLLANYARLVPLEIPYDWKSFLLHSLRADTRCDVHLLDRCYDRQAADAKRILVFSRADILCAFKICDECLDALSWVRPDHPHYAGPFHQWRDDGKRSSEGSW